MSRYPSPQTTSRHSADRALCAALRQVPVMSLFGAELINSRPIDGEKLSAVEPPVN